MLFLRRVFNMIPIFFIILSVSLNHYFQQNQYSIVLESNGLKSFNHVIVSDENKDDLFSNYNNQNALVWILQEVRLGDQKVLNIFSNKWDELKLPLISGRHFSNNDSKAAIVGQSVETIKKGNKEYFRLNNCYYEVIGKLGQLQNSPLKDNVLLSDSNLVSKDSGEVSLNGQFDSKFAKLGVTGDNLGVERLYSSSAFALLLQVTTLFITSLSSFIWIYFLLKKQRAKYHLFHLLGRSKLFIYSIEIAKIFLMNAVFISFFILLFYFYNQPGIALQTFLPILLIELVSFTILFFRGLTYEKV